MGGCMRLIMAWRSWQLRFSVRLSRSDPFQSRATGLRVPRRIVLMLQLWLRWDVAFELHPIETLDILALVCLDETLHPKAFH